MLDHLGEIALYFFATVAGIQIIYFLFIFFSNCNLLLTTCKVKTRNHFASSNSDKILLILSKDELFFALIQDVSLIFDVCRQI